MSEVLSQSEIDELLEALSSGTLKVDEVINDENKKKVKPYDFRRPNKFSKDQLRTLVMLHENFARLLTTSLSAYLRSMVRIQVVSIDQLTYEEFTKSLNNPTVMNLIALKPLEGTMIFEINPQIAFAMVDRLLGGVGRAVDKIRELTDIEQMVIKRVLFRMMNIIKEAWQTVVELEPVYESIELNPLFTQIIPPSDMVVLVTMEVKIAEVLGLMNICLPFSLLEPITNRLSAQFWFARTNRISDNENLSVIQKRLVQANIDVAVELGNALINLGDLLNIKVGDVIQLDQPVKGLLNVKIGNELKFKGSPGVSGSHMGVQVGQIMREEGA